MAIVTFNDVEYSCSKAYKGSNYIHLVDSSGKLTAVFENVKDFSAFAISDGEWITPTSASNCYIAVLGDDGTVQKSDKKACDLALAADMTALNAGGLLTGQSNYYRVGRHGVFIYADKVSFLINEGDVIDELDNGSWKYGLNFDHAEMRVALPIENTDIIVQRSFEFSDGIERLQFKFRFVEYNNTISIIMIQATDLTTGLPKTFGGGHAYSFSLTAFCLLKG